MLLSIAIGVTAIGMVMGAQNIVDETLPAAYAAVNPASGTVFAINTFDDTMIESIRRMDEVAEAEGQRYVSIRFLDSAGDWRVATLCHPQL